MRKQWRRKKAVLFYCFVCRIHYSLHCSSMCTFSSQLLHEIHCKYFVYMRRFNWARRVYVATLLRIFFGKIIRSAFVRQYEQKKYIKQLFVGYSSIGVASNYIRTTSETMFRLFFDTRARHTVCVCECKAASSLDAPTFGWLQNCGGENKLDVNKLMDYVLGR